MWNRIVVPGVATGVAMAALRLAALAFWLPVARTDLFIPVALAGLAAVTVRRAGFAGSAASTTIAAVFSELLFIEGAALLGLAPWRGPLYLGTHVVVVALASVAIWGLVAIVVAAVSRYRGVGYAFGAVFAVGAAVLLSFGWNAVDLRFRPYGDRRFDAATWQADGGMSVPRSRRGLMVGDLRARVIRAGMTRADVLTTMGEPEFRSADGSVGYALGLWSGSKRDYDSMDVEFDARDRVVRTVLHSR